MRHIVQVCHTHEMNIPPATMPIKKSFESSGMYALLFDVFLTFRRIAFPSSLWSNNPRRIPSGENWSYYIGNLIFISSEHYTGLDRLCGFVEVEAPRYQCNQDTVTTVPKAANPISAPRPVLGSLSATERSLRLPFLRHHVELVPIFNRS
jgi:hypothetical protein